MIFKESLITKLGPDLFASLQTIKIGIAGAGGLGSNCAACLVRAGFSRLTVVDFDIVEPANLDRQFYFEDQVGRYKVEALKENLLRINPCLEMEAKVAKLGKLMFAAVFQGCDIVAECLDCAATKSLLVAELLPLRKFMVTASGLGGYGKSDQIRVHRIKDHLIMIGDLESDIEGNPALAPRVALVAAKQADVILEYALTRLRSFGIEPS